MTVKMNREQAIKLMMTINDPELRNALVAVLRSSADVDVALEFILRVFAESMSSRRGSFKKRRQGYAIEKRSLRSKREGGQ